MFRRNKIKEIQAAMLQESYAYKRLTRNRTIENHLYAFIRFNDDCLYCGWVSKDCTPLQKEAHQRFIYNAYCHSETWRAIDERIESKI